MKIIFMGTPSYATEILKAIIPLHDVVALFTQPDKPVGRKRVLTPPHIKDFALQNECKFPIFQPKSLKDDEITKKIKELNPDIIVVAAYGMILPKSVLDICPCINLHASLLPKYRGASPIQQAILKNEKYSGVTAMKMDVGLDTGDMLGFSYVKLDDKTTSEELFLSLSNVAAKLIVKVLKNFEKLLPLKQNNALSSYAPKISKQDGMVDLHSQKSASIDATFRAFTPWPGVFLPNGVKLLRFTYKRCDVAKSAIISKIDKKSVSVTCEDGELELQEVQPPSKKPMSAYAYILGQRKSVGDRVY